MESRAAEPTMWRYLDDFDFNAQPPVFDVVLTHDSSLLQRALPLTSTLCPHNRRRLMFPPSLQARAGPCLFPTAACC